MDELSLFTDLRPAPDPVELTGARRRLSAAITSAPAHRNRRLAMAGGLAAAATAAAIAVPTVLSHSGGSGTRVTNAAWTVDLKQDGTVVLTVQQAFGNLNGLQQTLRADGVPAIVELVPWKLTSAHGGIQAAQACGYGGYIARNSEPKQVQSAAVSMSLPAIGSYAGTGHAAAGKTSAAAPGQLRWIIHPGVMPRGSVLFFVASPAANKDGVGSVITGPFVVRDDQTPVCVPGDSAAFQWRSR